MVEPFRFLAEGAMLGLATGHICLATCGPVYAPFLMQKERTFSRNVMTVLQLSMGRFVTYLFVGALAGLFGRHIDDLQRDYFTFFSYVLFSTYLIISALRSRTCEGGCAAGRWSRFSEWPFLLGMLSGINICPSFLLAFSRSFTLSGPVAGMLFFAAFFVGTSIFLAPLAFIGLLGYKRRLRAFARFAAIGVAAWFLGNAGVIGYDLVKQAFDRRPVINLLDERPMYVVMKDPGRARIFAVTLAAKRPGPVFVSDSAIKAASYYYVLTEASRLSDAKTGAPLRKPGVFVAAVADRYVTGADSIATMVAFLKNFHFRFNTEKGDIFYLR